MQCGVLASPRCGRCQGAGRRLGSFGWAGRRLVSFGWAPGWRLWCPWLPPNETEQRAQADVCFLAYSRGYISMCRTSEREGGKRKREGGRRSMFRKHVHLDKNKENQRKQDNREGEREEEEEDEEGQERIDRCTPPLTRRAWWWRCLPA